MTFRTQLFLLLTCTATGLAFANAQLQAESASARTLKLNREYLQAYEELNWERLAEFYADDVVWQDPTSSVIGGSPDPVAGKAKVIAHLKAATLGVEALDFEFTKQFHANGLVVNLGAFSYSLPNPDPSKPEDKLEFSLDTVVLVEIADGKIRRHTDYADFESWLEQYRKQAQSR